mmetsp:Transcript_8007/g.19649  ORF Transcript_8007/g.19649 Transcript_8007/m.19649 type:complete len:202 (-) Transcript_8007:411-1016(-)
MLPKLLLLLLLLHPLLLLYPLLPELLLLQHPLLLPRRLLLLLLLLLLLPLLLRCGCCRCCSSLLCSCMVRCSLHIPRHAPCVRLLLALHGTHSRHDAHPAVLLFTITAPLGDSPWRTCRCTCTSSLPARPPIFKGRPVSSVPFTNADPAEPTCFLLLLQAGADGRCLLRFPHGRPAADQLLPALLDAVMQGLDVSVVLLLY